MTIQPLNCRNIWDASSELKLLGMIISEFLHYLPNFKSLPCSMVIVIFQTYVLWECNASDLTVLSLDTNSSSYLLTASDLL